MTSSFADRSRVLSYQSCPRKRYYEYEIQTGGEVGGVRPSRLDMNLIVGGAFHAGAEVLLRNAMLPQPVDNTVDWAVTHALDGDGDWGGFWPQVKAHGLILDPEEDASYVAYEQAALIEALIRAYAVFVLPILLDRFTVVDVEREEVGTFEIPGFTLRFGARVDAILLEKSTSEIFVLSLKTAKEWGKREDDSARHDMQGLSESRVVEQRLAGWHKALSELVPEQIKEELSQGCVGWLVEEGNSVPRWFAERFLEGGQLIVSGVLMQYALKGRRENSPKGSHRYAFNNALIRPWKKADDLGGGGYAIRYDYTDPMGGNHRLGKGWNRVNIWEDMGVKKWIEYLASNELQGFPAGYALEQQFILPMEYFRNAEDMDRWERQIVCQERRVEEGRKDLRKAVELGQTDILEPLLDQHFPMHTRACDWPTKCSFQEVCFGPAAYLHDPISSGLYQIRVPNHKTELEGLTKS